MSSIRNIAVGLPVRNGQVLVLTGFDSVKGKAFHRAIGGGIEFGETAEAALRREFVEELGVTLDAVNLVSVSEDIFEYEGEPGHHVAHIYSVHSAAIDAIPLDAELHVLDEGSPITWVRVSDATLPFYPEGVADALGKLVASSS